MNLNYEFTNNWFEGNKDYWNRLLAQVKPTRVLEIGSYEGQSTCYLMEKLAEYVEKDPEIHCIDNWMGGLEHQKGGGAFVNMNDVESPR
jgi:hypothetical protein